MAIKPGKKVLLTLVGNRKVPIEPVPEDPIEAACGMLRDGPSLTEALLKERREDHVREDKKLLDSFAMLAFLNKESGFEKVRSLLANNL